MPKVDIYFVELASFANVREEHFGGDENFRRLQIWLAANPKYAPVIPGTRGLRKASWIDPTKGKGKRSGFRIIYLFIEDASVIVFFRVYSKNVSEDMTVDQRRAATKAVQAVRDGFIAKKNESDQNE